MLLFGSPWITAPPPLAPSMVMGLAAEPFSPDTTSGGYCPAARCSVSPGFSIARVAA
ncbi:MAG: hypothetical protein QM820_40775 [Minicystis sp.]